MRSPFHSVFDTLLEAYGPQHWWPADSLIEMMVGAVLIQNTAWPNVEKAMKNLKSATTLTASTLLALNPSELARLIKPAGLMNVKSDRLRNLLRWYHDGGEYAGLAALDTEVLRTQLLEVKGVGKETADDILVYGFGRPVFIIDAYTRRIGSRLGMVAAKGSYEVLREQFETALPRDASLYGEMHALIVNHAKVACRRQPRCENCCLGEKCEWNRSRSAADVSITPR